MWQIESSQLSLRRPKFLYLVCHLLCGLGTSVVISKLSFLYH